MGRRRIASARHLMIARDDARFQTIKCEVYEWNAPRLNAFLGLVENEQRAASWVADVIRLRQLIREGVAMTLDDLKAYGFHAKTIKGRLDIALLPNALLDQICAGTVSLEVAMQITRLKEAERERLDTLAQDGEAITPELVKSLLRRQVNQGLISVQGTVSQMWTTLPTENQVPSFSQATQIPVATESSSVATVLTLLKQFEPQTQSNAALQRVGMLTRVLIKELEIVLCTDSLTTQEGETSHV